MKKIIYYSDCWGIGGIESFTLAAASFSAKNGYKPSLFSLYCEQAKAIEKARRLKLPLFIALKSKENLFYRSLLGPWHWRKHLLKEKPDIVHINIMNGWGLIYAVVAKEAGVPAIVVHSHNSSFGNGHRTVKRIIHEIGCRLWGRLDILRLACSQEAGMYLFKSREFQIIRNGIDADHFRFDKNCRKQIRDELKLHDKLVLGAIGRLVDSKQPLFQIDLIKSLIDVDSRMHLLLIGDGNLVTNVIEQIQAEGLEEYVTVLPAVADPAPYYSAYDLITMPSKFEGLPVALVEAICNGLPCVISSEVPDPGIIREKLIRENTFSICEWTRDITRLIDSNSLANNRGDGYISVNESGYNQDTAMQELIRAYEQYTKVIGE